MVKAWIRGHHPFFLQNNSLKTHSEWNVAASNLFSTFWPRRRKLHSHLLLAEVHIMRFVHLPAPPRGSYWVRGIRAFVTARTVRRSGKGSVSSASTRTFLAPLSLRTPEDHTFCKILSKYITQPHEAIYVQLMRVWLFDQSSRKQSAYSALLVRNGRNWVKTVFCGSVELFFYLDPKGKLHSDWRTDPGG